MSGQHHLLEEGLATFLGTDLQWAGIAEPGDIRAGFESVEGNERGLPAEYYPVAGHFISFLVEEHALPSVVSLVEASVSGKIWRDILIDVPEATNGLVYIFEGHPVELVVRACGQGCSTPFERMTSEMEGEHYINQSFELREGLTLVRVIKPIEAEGRVRFSVNLGCP